MHFEQTTGPIFFSVFDILKSSRDKGTDLLYVENLVPCYWEEFHKIDGSVVGKQWAFREVYREPSEPVRILQYPTEETNDIIDEGQNNLTKWILRTEEPFFLGVGKRGGEGLCCWFWRKMSSQPSKVEEDKGGMQPYSWGDGQHPPTREYEAGGAPPVQSQSGFHSKFQDGRISKQKKKFPQKEKEFWPAEL